MILELVKIITCLRGLQMATKQWKTIAESIEDSMRLNPCRRNICTMQADDPGVVPENSQCCRERRNRDAHASGGEYGEEIVLVLMEVGVYT